MIRGIAMMDAEAVAGDSKTVGGLVAKLVQHSLHNVVLSLCLSPVSSSRCYPLWVDPSLFKLSSVGRAILLSEPSSVGQATIVQAVLGC